VSGTTTGASSYAEFGGVIDYYWTDINSAGVVGTTTALGSLNYYWLLTGPGTAFLQTVAPTGAQAATPIGSTGGLLSIIGEIFVAGDPAFIEVVPEPTTTVALITGLAGLLVARRCRAVQPYRREVMSGGRRS
jgi:hypothetical protein